MELFRALQAPGKRARQHGTSKTLAKFTDKPVWTRRDFILAQAAVNFPQRLEPKWLQAHGKKSIFLRNFIFEHNV